MNDADVRRETRWQTFRRNAPAYAGTANSRALNPGAIRRSGGGQPHENRPPHLTLNYCIALEGILPARD